MSTEEVETDTKHIQLLPCTDGTDHLFSSSVNKNTTDCIVLHSGSMAADTLQTLCSISIHIELLFIILSNRVSFSFSTLKQDTVKRKDKLTVKANLQSTLKIKNEWHVTPYGATMKITVLAVRIVIIVDIHSV